MIWVGINKDREGETLTQLYFFLLFARLLLFKSIVDTVVQMISKRLRASIDAPGDDDFSFCARIYSTP
jgi:hypothetical protein